MSKIGDKIKGLKNKAKRRARQAAIVGAATFAVAGATSCSNKTEEKKENEMEYRVEQPDTVVYSRDDNIYDIQRSAIGHRNRVIKFSDEGTNVAWETKPSKIGKRSNGKEFVEEGEMDFWSKREVAEGDRIDGHPVLKRGKKGKPDSVLVETVKEGEKKVAKYMPVDLGDELVYDTGVFTHNKGNNKTKNDTTYTYDETGKHEVIHKAVPEKKVRKLNYKVKPKERD